MDAPNVDPEENTVEEKSMVQLLSPNSPDMNHIYEDPEILPRIGDEYQANIPFIISEFNTLQVACKESITQETGYIDYSTGLPIQIIWFDTKLLGSIGYARKNTLDGPMSHLGNESDETVKVDDCSHANLSTQQWEITNLHDQYGRKPVPGSQSVPWSNFEQQIFLLGLYIFGKNLVHIKKFVGKEMGDILSFYYGIFYQSSAYKRWSDCRKMRNKRCIHGQRIFTGWRQQELLSRLLCHASEENQNTLIEASKTFGEGKISLEEYVFTIKEVVGMQVLVEAVGIGKGKDDLTGIAIEPIKGQQTVPRSDVPIGKACSTLTNEDIIKYLTGDFRLSKARSNDLFWEAVWPRLLARGWHSEQPRDQRYFGSKNLVFLIPNIKMFSRRKLVKGTHYFDSVTDVLNKVASNPEFLQIEPDASKDSTIKEETGMDMNKRIDEKGSFDHKDHSYLCSRVPNFSSELLKFTVVDTSLVSGEPFKFRELRALPSSMNSLHNFSTMSLSDEADDGSEEEINELNDQDVDCQDTLDENKLCSSLYDEGKSEDTVNGGFSEKMRSNLLDIFKNMSKQTLNVNLSGSYNMESAKEKKCHNQIKRGQSTYLSPISKRKKLTSSTIDCNAPYIKEERQNCHVDLASLGDTTSKSKLSPCSSNTLLESNNEDICIYNLSSKGDSVLSKPGVQDQTRDHIAKPTPKLCHRSSVSLNPLSETVQCDRQPQPRGLIDLNLLPQNPLDYENCETSESEKDGRNHLDINKTPFLEDKVQHRETQAFIGENNVDILIQPIENARRHSTRNRPLTTRALEALACDYWNPRRKGRGVKVLAQENPTNGHSRKSRMTACTMDLELVQPGISDSKIQETEEGCNSSITLLDESQICSTNNNARDILRIQDSIYTPNILSQNDKFI